MKNKKEEMEEVVFEDIVEEKTTFKNKKDKGKKALEACLDERQEYLDGWQRSRAEIVNLKKQHLEEKKLFTNFGKEQLLIDFLPVLDNFNAAFNSESWNNVDENWRVGVEYIYKQFLDVLEKNNVQEFGDVNDELDYEKYEIIEEVESDLEKDSIVELVQKGYKLGDKIVRPAKVKVSK